MQKFTDAEPLIHRMTFMITEHCKIVTVHKIFVLETIVMVVKCLWIYIA